ncbi:hypothetical protein SDC9_155355 [bioreactor metagenome]|uniref:Uncharacterized protein n=1 Tax=bioreactor metagenome TaxID=1076179 RepID=A0A645F3S4_9ZZZZ
MLFVNNADFLFDGRNGALLKRYPVGIVNFKIQHVGVIRVHDFIIVYALKITGPNLFPGLYVRVGLIIVVKVDKRHSLAFPLELVRNRARRHVYIVKPQNRRKNILHIFRADDFYLGRVANIRRRRRHIGLFSPVELGIILCRRYRVGRIGQIIRSCKRRGVGGILQLRFCDFNHPKVYRKSGKAHQNDKQ